MDLTPYHAKFFAYELTRRCPSDSVERLVGALADAQVDLNPHQLDAALFDAQDESERQRDSLIEAIETRLNQNVSSQGAVSVSWSLRRATSAGKRSLSSRHRTAHDAENRHPSGEGTRSL
jgi:hypothetical protein